MKYDFVLVIAKITEAGKGVRFDRRSAVCSSSRCNKYLSFELPILQVSTFTARKICESNPLDSTANSECICRITL